MHKNGFFSACKNAYNTVCHINTHLPKCVLSHIYNKPFVYLYMNGLYICERILYARVYINIFMLCKVLYKI